MILSGAGISAESGLKTFRDTDGLWEGHRVEDVATPDAWHRNPALVLAFYNERRKQLMQAQPNAAHKSIARLESKYEVDVITQNVDDLHERAGSNHILHLHGELLKARSTVHPDLIYDWTKDLLLGDLCDMGSQLRPHIVWFGEQVPLLEQAAIKCHDADICIIIGTSMQVYPAAGLVSYLRTHAQIFYVDPKPVISPELRKSLKLQLKAVPATVGVPVLVLELLELA